MKIDLKKQLNEIYNAPSKAPVFVDVPAMNYLMIDGSGDPNISESYSQAVEALFSMSYAAKFHIKKGETGVDYGVMPLEGLWWTDNPADFNTADKGAWKWTAMMMQPEWVTSKIVEIAREKAENKLVRTLSDVRFEAFEEGRAAQIMHIGPYADEEPTIKTLHKFVVDHSLSLRDKHHEIYLSDPRRTKPERLKTVIRHPVV